MKIKRGSARLVFLIGQYAFKFPEIHSYERFLYGLLANSNESHFSKLLADTGKVNPVVLKLPFGLCNIYRRADPIGHDVFWDLKYAEWIKVPSITTIPVEHKYNSFGIVDGEVVAIDYH